MECLSSPRLSQRNPPHYLYPFSTRLTRPKFIMSQQPHGRAPWPGYPYDPRGMSLSTPTSTKSNLSVDYSESQRNMENMDPYQPINSTSNYPAQEPQFPGKAIMLPYVDERVTCSSRAYVPRLKLRVRSRATSGRFLSALSKRQWYVRVTHHCSSADEKIGFGPSPSLVYAYPEVPDQHRQQDYTVPHAEPGHYIPAPVPVGQSSSSGETSDLGSQDGTEFSSLSARRQNVQAWLARTKLNAAQIEVANAILTSSWWANEDPEPEVQHNDMLARRGILPVGGSRFRAFLDESNGYKCAFDHDGQPCGHGKGRPERALGNIRRFFRYKPVTCNGSCGDTW
jgi:hypothetical protein